MPKPPQSSARSTAESSILLVEEYDALAAAIGSALKKFAPRHRVDTARSLGDAEALAQTTCPALFVIDFDPAFFGLTTFLYRMREQCPDARALIIGPGASNDIASEFRSFGTLHFVAKPFEVPDFGAAVQALLGPASGEMGQRHASLSSLGPADLVLGQCTGKRTSVLAIKGKGERSGEVHIIDGHIVHATAGRRRNGAALEEIFGWSDSRVEEIEKRSTAKRTICEPWTDIFLEAVRHARRLRPDKPYLSKQIAAEKPRTKAGKKLVVIDDTEMLLVFVEDTLTLADPELQITTAPNGTTGIKQIERVMPDLILLDYSLPDINGDEVCRRLLESEQTARIPVLMMSGHVPEMTATAKSLENIVATIAKPFISETFVALVQQILNAEPRPVPPIVRLPEAAKAPPRAIPQTKPAAKSTQPKQVSPPSVAKSPPLAQPPSVGAAPPTVPPPARAPTKSTISAPIISKGPNEVVLGLFLEVLAMQLTPSLRMGAIRAKPSSFMVSLHMSPAVLPVENAFQLGRVELNATGKIDKVHLMPTQQPFQPLPTRNALQIGALHVVPHSSRDRFQLTSSQNAPMMMNLLAHLELGGVELGPNFQVAQVVLKSQSNVVRVTFSSEAAQQTGVFCEMSAVQLDASARLAALTLKPLK